MSINEQLRALGSWSVQLDDRTPQDVIDLLLNSRFGHIAIDAARDNPTILGDALMASARYVGVLRATQHEGGGVQLSGSGMAFWLGAEDGLGDVYEDTVSFAAASFSAVFAGLLPAGGAVTAGTFTAPVGDTPYSGSHRYQTARQALDYVCELKACDWRVNGDATVDVGPAASLFVTDPQAAIIRRGEGLDMNLRALPGSARTTSDVSDFSTRVVTLATGEGSSIKVGTADIEDAGGTNPYVDLHGNPVVLTRLVSESNTSGTNADARAAVALAQYVQPRDQLTLSTDTHDLRGDVAVGDSVWVYDPDAGVVGSDAINFKGSWIYPVKLRVYEMSYPVEQGMGVYFRTPTGQWLDLTDYVQVEANSSTELVVGAFNRSLTTTSENVGFRPNISGGGDASVPGAPTMTPPFDQGLYVGPGGLTRATVLIKWFGPALNLDGTPVTDLSHYEIRFRRSDAPTWGDLGDITWGELGTWGDPLGEGSSDEATDWQYTTAPADTSIFLQQELTPGISYDFQIRAVDTASPTPNAGPWSSTHREDVTEDNDPPPAPAAPVVSASLVQIGIKHNLGLLDGGTFNLPLDLAYLEIHVGAEETFTADVTGDSITRVGKLLATRAQITGEIPVVGTFPVPSPAQVWVRVIAVDQAGNQSDPSDAAAVTATLIDSQWVSELTADKITAGSFTATYGLVGLFIAGNPTAARFAAGDDGTRQGFMLHRPSGTLAIHGDATTGNLKMFGTDGTTATLTFTASTGLIDMLGKLTAGSSLGSGARLVIDPAFTQPGGATFPTALFYSASGAFGPGRINATDQAAGITALGMNSGPTATGTTFEQSTLFLFPAAAFLSVNAGGGGNLTADRRSATLGLTKTAGELTFSPSGVDRSTVRVNSTGAYLIGKDTSGVQTSYVAAQANGNVELVSNADMILDPGGDLYATKAFGDSGGFIFRAQTGGSDGLTAVYTSGALRFWDGGSYVEVGGAVAGGYKTFVIDHPLKADRWLVHAAAESPTADVVYRGVATVEDRSVTVDLPSYFEGLTSEDNRQTTLTVIVDGAQGGAQFPTAVATIPRNGQFRIDCDTPGTRVAWLVHAARKDSPPLVVEPRRADVHVAGTGPYRFLTAKPGMATRPTSPRTRAGSSPSPLSRRSTTHAGTGDTAEPIN